VAPDALTPCARCKAESASGAKWCKDCEQQFDGWSRQYAGDIVWQALIGTLIVSGVGLGLPLLGVGKLIAAVGAFAGFGTIVGLHTMTRRRRRQQFLATSLPRAYLPQPK